ncbi:sensor histidine kinase [Erysipelothrix sp. HDW6A]|uniref:cache domain-containing sensor histidine kinase n=1 Tax=Erysipelothrix sp. HDW6A TaxID=2714928 RepID=UPI001408F3F7|nr:sensor histidine kinase [Erysipelothrix sp. HDW6A]QIK57838.1 sensor histidine kinase [Erysipelothrix sp. HDW6A]
MRTPKNRSIKRTLTLIILLSSTIPLLLLGVFSVYFIQTSTQSNLNARLNEILMSANELIDTTISNQITDIETMGRSIIQEAKFDEDSKLLPESKENINRGMYQYMRGDKSLQNMYYIMTDGTYTGTYDLPDLYSLPKYQNWGIFRTLEANNAKHAIFFPNMTLNDDKFKPSYSIAYKLQSQGVDYGYLIMDVSTEYLQNILTSVKGTSFGYIQFILTTKADMIIYNDSSFRSQVSFLQNIFRYDRLDIDQSSDVKVQLEDMTMMTRVNEKYGIKIYGLVPNSMLTDQVRFLSISIAGMIAFTGVIATVIGYRSTRKVSDPISELVDRMREIRPYDNDDTKEKYTNELEELSYQFDEMLERISYYHENDNKKQELLRIAEIKSLMSQINPHFLNNTLDSIKWRAKLSGVSDIPEMVTELSVLLKASMNTNPFVSLEEELSFVESYIHIQQFRYKDKIRYFKDIQEEALTYSIPKLIIQPIVENSIIHGIEPSSKEGIIEINSWVDDKTLYITIADNGIGSDVDVLREASKENQGIGIINVNNRLKLHFGESYGLRWESKKGKGTVVFIEIPIEE